MQSEYSSSVRVFYPRFDREAIIKLLRSKVNNLKKELRVVMIVLFGSYAKDKYTTGSDIDVLVVYKGNAKDAYSIVKRAIGVSGVEPHIYSEEEYRAMRATVQKMIEGGVPIFVEQGFAS